MSVVAVVDDHASFGDGLAALLRGAGHEVVGIARSEAEAVALIDTVEVEVAVLDIELDTHGGGGLRVGRHLRETQPAAKLLFLSAHIVAGSAALLAAADLQPEAMLAKHEPATVVLDVVAHIVGGGTYFSPEYSSASSAGSEPFTAAERLVLTQLATKPDSRARLARSLGIAPSTLDTHITRIKAKVLANDEPGRPDPDDGHLSTEALIGWARSHGYHIT